MAEFTGAPQCDTGCMLFQVHDIFLGQLHRKCPDGFFQVRNFRRPNDRRYHGFFLQQPGKRDMGARRPVFFRKLRHALHDGTVAF